MWLRDTDLSSVLLEHLTSLTSLVTGSVYIWNLRGCDPASLLASVRCEALCLNRQRLGAEETSVLVNTLETWVERLHLGEVTLDMAALTMYDGGFLV